MCCASQVAEGFQPDQITIAVTVFNRRQYLQRAIASALDQTRPVRVMVVEDCGPDAGLEAFVRAEFGGRVEYRRNPRRRGLFDNWNACTEYCHTPWLSILHDDDFLAPDFVEAMLELNRQAPECCLYFGKPLLVDEQERPLPRWACHPDIQAWRRVGLEDMIHITPFHFAGQLFRLDAARAVGGFNPHSQYCGDWQMWARLTATGGAAQTPRIVGYTRRHSGPERGTNRIVKCGRLWCLTYVQHKRVLALLRQSGKSVRFDRPAFLRHTPMAARYLIEDGIFFPRRVLAYNMGLLRRSPSPNWGHGLFKVAARCLGRPLVLALSWAFNRIPPLRRLKRF